MPFLRIPQWISRRFGSRTTIDEMNEALNLNDDTNINDVIHNERLLFQFIMRNWINEMDQRFVDEGLLDENNRGPAAELLNSENNNNIDTEQDDVPEIPVLNMDDVDLALREHINNNQRGTLWIKFIDILGVTLFPMLFLRILKNVFSFISFSDDILEDTDNFLSYIEDNSFESLVNDKDKLNSLIAKFARIVYEELIYYSPRPRPSLARYLTLVCFYVYTTFTSLFMMVSFLFLLLCLTYTFGKRWSYIDKFLVNVTKDSNGIF